MYWYKDQRLSEKRTRLLPSSWVIEVIKLPARRGQEFSGDEKVFGSSKNGNIMEILKMIAKFDPFLAELISRLKVKKVGQKVIFL